MIEKQSMTLAGLSSWAKGAVHAINSAGVPKLLQTPFFCFLLF
ncbi:unnamed protein product [Staurois parvus]|uniref:Uncharacterized protein n=1 Tax=Staurois parvus TaxID=386267 RepID=A0ABN9BJQ7_9NEOB|nr:unnamed protein product [Staurois parvus]